MPSPVCVLEVLGRNAGWIVAATSLARHRDGDTPHLIYFPERPSVWTGFWQNEFTRVSGGW
jgi:6-phosphofructokinase